MSVAPNVANEYGEYVCRECNTLFTSSYYALRRHVKQFHKGKEDEIAPLKRRECSFVCDICGRKFKYKKHLTFHKKSHVLSDSNKKPHTTNKSGKKCPLCSYKESSKTQLCNHFKKVHDVNISTEKLEFATKKDFEDWKILTESSSKSQFVKECGDVTFETHETLSYVCHRSGFYISKGQNKRRLRTKGSSKIDGFCPAGMKVIVNSNGQCQVTYNKTHVGHTFDLAYLNLPSTDNTLQQTHVKHTDNLAHLNLPSTDNALQKTKDEIRRWLDAVLDSIQSHSQMTLLKKLIVPIEPALKAAASTPLPIHNIVQVPHNKKVDKQQSLFLTKKKTKR